MSGSKELKEVSGQIYAAFMLSEMLNEDELSCIPYPVFQKTNLSGLTVVLQRQQNNQYLFRPS